MVTLTVALAGGAPKPEGGVLLGRVPGEPELWTQGCWSGEWGTNRDTERTGEGSALLLHTQAAWPQTETPMGTGRSQDALGQAGREIDGAVREAI